jgi:hypothetical protein
MNKKQILYFLFCGIVFFSCNPSILSPTEFIKWIEDEENNLIQTKTINDLEYKLQYKPIEYIVAKDKVLGDIDFSKKRIELGDLQYFTFQIKILGSTQTPLKYNLSSENEYYERIKYFSFEIQRDLKLIVNNDTLNCVLAHFERTFNISPTATFSLAFENNNETEIFDKEFIYTDKVFNTGPLRFIIKKQDIIDIPELKL